MNYIIISKNTRDKIAKIFYPSCLYEFNLESIGYSKTELQNVELKIDNTIEDNIIHLKLDDKLYNFTFEEFKTFAVLDK